MADDGNPLRHVFAYVVDKLKHNHPRPKSAAPPFPRRERVPGGMTPGGMAPGGTTQQGRPAPSPADDARDATAGAGGSGQKAAERSLGWLKEVFDPPVAAKDPARQSLLDAGAKVRRDELRKEEAASRASQGRTHAEAVELLREKLSAQGKSPILRVAIEHELEQKAATHAEEVRVVDDYFAMRWASTEAAIKTAGELGYFTDARAEAEGRAADRETGRGDDEGGRGMED